MNVKIKESGKLEQLSIIDRKSGVDWTNDLIGNAGALIDGQFTWSEDDDAYLTDQSTYDWWAQYIADSETTEQEIEQLADEMYALAGELGLDSDDIRLHVQVATGNDYEQHRAEAIAALDEIRTKFHIRNAAATLGRKGGQSSSEAKAAAARENGRKGGRPTRYERIARLAGDGCTAEIVKDFVEYDQWDNQDEHNEWMESATDREIADWIATCRK